MTLGNQILQGLHPPVRDQDLSLFPSLPPCQPVAGCTCPNHRPSRSLAAAVVRVPPSSAHSTATTATEQPNNLRPSVRPLPELGTTWRRRRRPKPKKWRKGCERRRRRRKEERLDAAANRDFDARMQNPTSYFITPLFTSSPWACERTLKERVGTFRGLDVRSSAESARGYILKTCSQNYFFPDFPCETPLFNDHGTTSW